MELDGPLLAGLIFVLRVMNYSVGTVRLVLIGRGIRMWASLLAAVEALIFAVVIAGVVQDLENVLNMTAYCLGAAVGSWAGMELESRLVKSYVIVNVFASEGGDIIAAHMRAAGYGVTQMMGEGRDGMVMTLRSVINKREVTRLNKLINEVNPAAFIAIEEARGVRHGWLGTGRGKTL